MPPRSSTSRTCGRWGTSVSTDAGILRRRLRGHATDPRRTRTAEKNLSEYGGRRVVLDADHRVLESSEDLLLLGDALGRLADEDATAVEIVKLRLYAGLSVEEAADIMGLTPDDRLPTRYFRPRLAALRARRRLLGGINYRFR